MELYPDINDPEFQQKVANKQEFRALYSPDGLHEHQEFVRRFLSPHTPYNCLLLYHALGSGKSFACIAVAVDHYIHSSSKCMVVTKGESGRNNFRRQVQAFYKMSTQKDMWNEHIFVMKRYISLSNYISKKTNDELFKQFSNLTIVLDEIHNVSYSSNTILHKEQSANVFAQLQRLLLHAKDIVVLMCTATPMTDSPDQLRSILTLCNVACKKETIMSMNGIISYNDTVKDKPEPIFEGENYSGVKLFMSEMTDHQRDMYIKEELKGTPNDIYRSLTHISLFCTPNNVYGRQLTDQEMQKSRITITHYTHNRERKITYLKFTPKPSLIPYLARPALAASSAKYSQLLNLLDCNDKTFVFVEEVQGSGLLLLASIFEINGYQMYAGETLRTLKPAKRYTLCVGRSDICPNIEDRLEGFNCPANNTGEYVQVLLGSKVISESISLLNVKQFHSMTPHWNHSNIDQAIGRVIRNGSHVSLRDKTVKLYRHAAFINNDGDKYGVDIEKIKTSISKQNHINSVRDQLIAHAVEKECFNPDFPLAKDFNTFAAVYSKYYIYDFLALSTTFIETCYLSDLPNITNHHTLVCHEVISFIITHNLPLHHYAHHAHLYLRIYGNLLFTVSDPSLPFVTLPPFMTPRNLINESFEALSISFDNINPLEVFSLFRYWSVLNKIAFVETCIATGRISLLHTISHVYLHDSNTYFHFLMYKNLTTSYTSSNPTPKTPKGKTRYFDGTQWSYLVQDDEQYLFQCYHSLIHTEIEMMMSQYEYIGIISTIDGNMRLRLRQDRAIDLRYVMRGKNLQSINKTMLQQICASLSLSLSLTDNLDIYSFTIAQLANYIDTHLVSMGRYLII